ncbi:hypothetical protein E3A20_05430 [Planctomyces bekefii]|uniref:Uncharacterized protein n=1 Tax=Planctomyces bekefii TaxID=1653850 RepID=A0A5C6MAR6_9PLAN|nr:hypothetical protein E3A20_05430 [Planctomyces bekefii]
MDNKIVSINVDAMKQKVASARQSIGSMAKERKDKALVSVLEKGIELSKRQLSALESVRKNFG